MYCDIIRYNLYILKSRISSILWSLNLSTNKDVALFPIILFYPHYSFVESPKDTTQWARDYGSG